MKTGNIYRIKKKKDHEDIYKYYMLLDESFPEEIDEKLENLHIIRKRLKGNFSEKVKRMNEITSVLVADEHANPLQPHLIIDRSTKPKYKKLRYWLIYGFASLALMIAGHILFSFLPLPEIRAQVTILAEKVVDSTILYFIVGGFLAQMVDGALGMAYGVSATTFLLSLGITPAAASASVHASEIFTTGASGLMHLRFKNVNTKLFRSLLIPGILGAILGAYILSSLEEYNNYIKPIVSAYTLFLGFVIITKVLKKKKNKEKNKKSRQASLCRCIL